MATNVQVRQDWNNDGFLRITGAETLQRYSELCQQQNNIPIDKYGVFFAFDQGQFDNGYKGLVKKGFIKEGEKIKSFGQGCFGILDGMKRWMKECRDIDDQIRAECDPYEVYLYEYNNFECCIDWDGDTRAVEKVISLFGAAGAAALQGRRMRAYETIDAIEENMNK